MFTAAAGAGGREDAAYLAVQRAGSPQAAGLIEEGAHLAHIAEAGRRAEDNAVIVRQLLRAGDRRLLMLFAPCFGKGLRRHGFRHAFNRHVHAVNPIRASATACAGVRYGRTLSNKAPTLSSCSVLPLR